MRVLIIFLLAMVAFASGPPTPNHTLLSQESLWHSPDSASTGNSLQTTIRWVLPQTFELNDLYVTVTDIPAICDSIYDSLGTYYDPSKFAVSISGDTLSVRRISSYRHFWDVNARLYAVLDSHYADTLIFRTLGSTKLRVPVIFDQEWGIAATGSCTITGWRSPGMDIYTSTGGRVVVATDSVEQEMATGSFSFTWSGLTHGKMESITVWGVTPEGTHSDTITVYRLYKQLGKGVWQ